MKKVLIVGNCRSDYIDLSGLIEINFKAKCTPALSIHEAKKTLEKDSQYDLILTNRSGYFDHKQGIQILEILKSLDLKIPVFLLTSQENKIKEAIKLGAKGGFSKDEIYTDEEKASVISLLKPYISEK
jgi:response regulator of citrate/malate metabolism